MSRIICYRYEDNNGFGPYWNEYKWLDDGWRSACDSIPSLIDWWENKKDMHLENYHIAEYTIETKNALQINKIKDIHIIDFKLEEVINKRGVLFDEKENILDDHLQL